MVALSHEVESLRQETSAVELERNGRLEVGFRRRTRLITPIVDSWTATDYNLL